MRSLLNNFLYFHGFFVFLLYLISNFFTIIILEYRLKNPNLRPTIAGFFCIGLSGIAAYYLPIFWFHTKHSSPGLQVASVIISLTVQIFFWWIWFRERFKRLAPALAIAFILSTLVAILTYNAFIEYMSTVTRAGLKRIISIK